MSVSREEEERNKNCPSRGLGIAVAAIGVGVGAALYYYFSKRPENPADEGATTSGWACEQPHVLQHNDHDSSYTTISEHSTSDTSIDSSSSDSEPIWHRSPNLNILETISRRLWSRDVSTDLDEHSDEDSYEDSDGSDTSDQTGQSESLDSNQFFDSQIISEEDSDVQYIDSDTGGSDVQYVGAHSPAETQERDNSNAVDIGLDSDTNREWDVTTSSLDIPREEQRSRSPIMMQFGELTVRLLNPQSGQWNRERTWTLEECSICFEVMLKTQEVMSLACTHRFHQSCIMPWLEQQQTCPNCRKAS